MNLIHKRIRGRWQSKCKRLNKGWASHPTAAACVILFQNMSSIYNPPYICCCVYRLCYAKHRGNEVSFLQPLLVYLLYAQWQDASVLCDCTQHTGGLHEEAWQVTVASASCDVVQTHGALLSKHRRSISHPRPHPGPAECALMLLAPLDQSDEICSW